MDQVLCTHHSLSVWGLVLVVVPSVTPAQVVWRGDLDVLVVWRWVWLCLVVELYLSLVFSAQKKVALRVAADLMGWLVALVWLYLRLGLAINVGDIGHLWLLLVGNRWWLVIEALSWANVYTIIGARSIIISLVSLMIEFLLHVCIYQMQVIDVINLDLRS